MRFPDAGSHRRPCRGIVGCAVACLAVAVSIRLANACGADRLAGVVLEFGADDGPIGHLRVSDDGKSLWTATRTGIVSRWNAETGERQDHWLVPSPARGCPIAAFAVTEDGTPQVRAGNVFVRWRQDRAAESVATPLPPLPADAEALSPSGRWLAWYDEEPWAVCRAWHVVLLFPPLMAHGEKPPVLLLDTATGRILRAVAPRSRADELAFSPDERVVASARYGRLYLWDLESDNEIRRRLEGTIRGIAFSDDGTQLFAAVDYEGILTIDAATGETIGTPLKQSLAMPEDDAGRTVLDVSPDGTLLAQSLPGGAIDVWETYTGQIVLHLVGHRDQVTGLAFLPDGRRLVSAGLDGRGYVWDLESADFVDPTVGEAPDRAVLDRLWRELGSADGQAAYRAYLTLLRYPDRAIDLIESPSTPDDLIRRLIRDLESDDSSVRSAAYGRLRRMSVTAHELLLDALDQAATVESAARLRRLLERLSGQEFQLAVRREQEARRDRILRARRLLTRIGTEQALDLERRLAAEPLPEVSPADEALDAPGEPGG